MMFGRIEKSESRRNRSSVRDAFRHQEAEVARCRDGFRGFLHWCREYVWIEDKDSHQPIRLKPYRCQVRLARWLTHKQWLRILKARRIGITWELAAFAVWQISFFKMRSIGYAVHKLKFAGDFIDRCVFIAERLPKWIRPVPSSSTNFELVYKHTESWIRALSASKGAADSLAADLVIIDEACEVDDKEADLLRSILRSIEPTVETSKGTIVLVGKSKGPRGGFYKGWQASEKRVSKYRNVFFSWKELPGRTQEWYERESRLHQDDPLFMCREYPSTPDEAFAQAEGRVYPMFNRATHVMRLRADGTFIDSTAETLWVPPHWMKWRGIDFGGTDPMVCLWMARVSGEGVRLTVDPACEYTIAEFLSYRYKPHTSYFEDKDNHCCFPAGTMVDTPKGPRSILEIGAGEIVYGHRGPTPVLCGCVQTGVQPIFRLTFSDGRSILCTAEHPLLGENGQWIRADRTVGTSVVVRKGKFDGSTECVTRDIRNRIWNASLRHDTSENTRRILPGLSKLRGRGMLPKKVFPGIDNRRQRVRLEKVCFVTSYANSAASPFRLESASTLVSVAIPAGIRLDWPVALTTLNDSALNAARRFQSTAMSKRKRAPHDVVVLQVVKVERLNGSVPVYDIATEDGSLSVCGVICANCDALRYIVESFRLQKGHYHVYRELYLKSPKDQGMEIPDFAALVKGAAPDEEIRMTVADRSQPLSINSLQLHGVPAMPNQHYVDEHATLRSRIAQGVRMVNALLIGTREFLPEKVRVTPHPDELVKPPPRGVSISLEQAGALRRRQEKKLVSIAESRPRSRRMRMTGRVRRRL